MQKDAERMQKDEKKIKITLAIVQGGVYTVCINNN